MSYSGDDLRRLLDLQGLDLRLAEAEAALAKARGATELEALRQELGAAEASGAALGKRLVDLRRDLKYSEQEVQALRAEVEVHEKRLYGGAVRNPKEAEQLRQYVVSLRRRVGDAEERTLQMMMDLEPAEGEAGATETSILSLRNQLATREADLAGAAEQLGAVLPGLREDRQVLVSSLPPVLVSTYEHLRPMRGGVAVVALRDGRCGGCRMAMPFLTVRDAKAGMLRTCDNCGRIVVA
jgi:hypothetical protein